MTDQDETQAVQIEFAPGEDGRSAVLAVKRAGKTLVEMALAAPALDALISRAGAVRAQIADPGPANLDTTTELSATTNPRWRIPAADQHDGRAVALRHPGFGWLGFVIPHNEAVQMARWLVHGAEGRER